MEKVTSHEFNLFLRPLRTFWHRLFLLVVLTSGLLLCGNLTTMAQTRRRNPARNMAVKTTPPQPAGAAADTEAGQETDPQAQRLTNERIVPFGIGIQQRRILLQVFEQLDLSAQQRGQLAQLRRDTGRRLDVLNRLRRAQNEALDESLYGTNFNSQEVEKRAADLAATSAEIIKLQATIISGIRQIMTPEQSARFRELLQEELRRRPVLPQRQPNNPE